MKLTKQFNIIKWLWLSLLTVEYAGNSKLLSRRNWRRLFCHDANPRCPV